MPSCSHSHEWAIVLAGGEGRRMAAVTRDAHGAHVPKQFCHFGGGASLLETAIGRAEHVVDPRHVIVVVQRAHQRWWEPELAGRLTRHVLAQPANRGTAVAVLDAVAHALAEDRDPYLVVLPSDQEVDDEAAWRATLKQVCTAAQAYSEELVLVAVEPQEDPSFGWVLPGEPADDGTRTVVEFVEKPAAEQAARLAARGGLCSAFVFAASARALLRLYVHHATDLIGCYEEAIRAAELRPAQWKRAYDRIPDCDFSHDILEHATGEVRVLPSAPCGWTDLGTPARLERWLARQDVSDPRRTAGAAHAGPRPSQRAARSNASR